MFSIRWPHFLLSFTPPVKIILLTVSKKGGLYTILSIQVKVDMIGMEWTGQYLVPKLTIYCWITLTGCWSIQRTWCSRAPPQVVISALCSPNESRPMNYSLETIGTLSSRCHSQQSISCFCVNLKNSWSNQGGQRRLRGDKRTTCQS